jgi:putative phage-type endonuclease
MTSINVDTILSDEELIQGSDEWFAARMGKITASRLGDIMRKTRYGESTYKAKVRLELAIERITGKSASSVVMNKAMYDGVEREPDARKLFEAVTQKEVALCGSFDHPTIPNTSASPDGLLRGENACLELKCPTHATHAKNLMSDTMDKRYLYQVQHQIQCTESDYAYFASYHPDFPPELRLKWVRVEKDDSVIKSLEEEIRAFDISIEDLIIKIKDGGNKNG